MGIWAIIYSGRAYIPLEPASPRSWLKEVRDLLGFTHALVEEVEGIAPALPDTVIALSLKNTPHPGSPTFTPISRPPGKDIAIFLTSGSTGTPKAITYQDRHLLFDALRQGHDLRITPNDQFDLLFPGWFSAATACIFPALLHGAGLHLYDLRARGVLELKSWMDDRGITISNMGVSAFRSFCKVHSHTQHLPDLRLMCLSAEQVQQEEVRLFRDNFPPTCTLQVAYASTEARTLSQWFYTHEMPLPGQVVPLGRPVSGKELTIVDESGMELPPNQTGEIRIRSAYIPLPKNNLPAGDSDLATLYTGDLGYFDESGLLWFAGRKDLQFKVRGLRIQPETIERAMRSLNLIADAVVVHHASAGIVGFYLSPKNEMPQAEIQEKLRHLLPSYLLPQKTIWLAEFPLNRNGKPDRQTLQSWNLPAQDIAVASMPEKDHILETILAAIQQVLKINHLTPGSHFFDDLGGDSLQAMEVWAIVCRGLNLNLPLDDFYFHPKPAHLAGKIKATLQQATSATLLLAQGEATLPPVFAISPYPNELGCYLHLARQWPGKEDLIGIRWSHFQLEPLSYIARKIALAIIDKQPDGDYRLLGYSFGGMLAFAAARELEQLTKNNVQVVLIDTPTYRPTQVWWKMAGYPLAKPKYLLQKAKGLISPSNKQQSPTEGPQHSQQTTRLIREFHPDQPLFMGRLTLFEASVPTVSGFHYRRDLDWEQWVPGGVQRTVVAGNHNQMVQPEAIATMLKALSAQSFFQKESTSR